MQLLADIGQLIGYEIELRIDLDAGDEQYLDAGYEPYLNAGDKPYLDVGDEPYLDPDDEGYLNAGDVSPLCNVFIHIA